MPSLRVGNTVVSNLELGTTQVRAAYLGTTLVWASSIEWTGSLSSLSVTARSSTWGPALVPSGRTVHWDASHEASFTYKPNTDLVLKWNDLSGNDWWLAEAQPGTNLQLPTRVIGYNGLPVVQFSADQWLVHWIDSSTPAEINLPQPITVQIVAAGSTYSGSVTGFIGGAGFGAAGLQVTMQTDTQILFAAGNFINYGYNTDQHVITAIWDGAGSGSVQRVDGVVLGTANPGTAGITRLQIGITHQLIELTVCEIVFYNRVLNSTEIAYNETLLTTKWFKPPGVWTGSAATVTIEGTARLWFTGTAPAFRPDVIESCFGWWDASDVSTFSFSTGVEVTQWRDKTTAARHLTAPSTGDRPDRTGTVNGLPVVSFDGAAWMYINDGATGDYLPPQPQTMFVVASVGTWATPPPNFFGLLSGALGATMGRAPNNSGGQFVWGAGAGTGATVDSATHLFAGVFDRAKSQQRIDSIQVSAVNTGPQDFGQFRVGTGSDASYKMVGTIAEIVVYNRNLNSTEISQVESYLTAKWFAPPGPQTWPGSSATMSLTATSGTWSIASVPGAPTLDTATPGNTTVALSWTAPSTTGGTLTGYLVEKSANGTSGWSTVTTTGVVLTYTVTGLTNGTIQYFRVSAINATGTGSPSNVMSATPVSAVPLVVTYSDSGAGGYTDPWPPLTLPSWSVVAGELLVVALGCCGGGTTISSSQWSLTGGGLTWTKRIEAFNPSNVYQSTAAFFTALATSTTTITDMVGTHFSGLEVCYGRWRGTGVHASQIGAIAGLADGSTDGQKDITLDATPDSSSILLAVAFVNADENNSTKKIDHGSSDGWTEDFDVGAIMTGAENWGGFEGQRLVAPTTTRVRWDDLRPASQTANTYSFAGVAIEIKAASAVVTVPSAPAAPTGDPRDASVGLTWSAPASGGAAITDYVVQYSSNSGSSWTTFSDATSTATSVTVTGLTNGTAYVFRVAAVNAVGQGSYSSASSSVTPVVGSWLFDYTDDADVHPQPSWTKMSGSDLGTKSGVLCCVDGSGNYNSGDFTYHLYNTSAPALPTFKAEVLFDSTDDDFHFLFFSNSDMSVRRTAGIYGNGSWDTGYQSGGTEGGSWTVPSFGSVMTVEVIVTSTSLCDIKVNGTTLKTGAGLLTQVAGNDRWGLLLARGARVRKLNVT